jgi:hypothetical protein
MLLTFVIAYLAVSIAIGLWAATRVHNSIRRRRPQPPALQLERR